MARKCVKKSARNPDSEGYQMRRTKYINRIFNLWRLLATVHDTRKTENEINKSAEEWDRANPKANNYHDLHYFTKFGALDYVGRLVEKARYQKRRIVLRLETGRGNNSIDNVPVIKTELLLLYGSREDFRICQDEANPGVLRLTVC